MNTREIAEEYRLSHWAKIIGQRQERGMSIKAFCADIGIHENVYYYWQRKLRTAACEQMGLTATAARAPGFAEVTVAAPPALASPASASLRIKVGGIEITADIGYPLDELVRLVHALSSPC